LGDVLFLEIGMSRSVESSSLVGSAPLFDQAERHQAWRDAGLLLLRAWLAVVFTYHGGQKLFGWFGGYGLEATAQWMGSVGIPLPTASALAASSAEVFGGWLLLLGLFARPAAAVLAFTMVVATWVHSGHGFDVRGQGIEYPATWLVVLVTLALVGPGRWTVGRLLAGRRSAASTSAGVGTAVTA
jgi:putative oxidoreductase